MERLDKMATVLTPEQIQGRERLSAISRQYTEEEAARGEADPSQNKIWMSIQGFVPNINLRYSISTNPMILFEVDMHVGFMATWRFWFLAC